MWHFYFLTIYILFSALIFAMLGKGKNISLLYLIANIGVMAFFAMFRSISVGNDTNDYINLFNNISSGVDLSVYTSRFEIGYLYLNKLLSYFSSNPQILLIVSSFYIFFVLGRFIYRYSNIPWLSVFLFFSLRFYDISLSGIRQMLAIATLFLAYEFLIDKKLLNLAIAIMVAGSFHSAAYLFLVAYPLQRYRLNKKAVFTTSIISLLLFINLNSILNIVLVYFPRYYSYVFSDQVYGEVNLSTILRLMVTLLILLASELFRKKLFFVNDYSLKENYNYNTSKSDHDQLQSLMLLLSCGIMFIALQVDIFIRFSNIFSIFAIIYLPNSITKISDRHIRSIAIMATVFLFFTHILAIQVLRPEWQSTYPLTLFWNSK